MTSAASTSSGLSRGLIFLFAAASGVMCANLYYAQTLIDQIGPDIGLNPAVAGLITTLTQLGYGVGLLLLVPLGDLFENRRLALIAAVGTVLATLGIAFSGGPITFLAASMLTGICATGTQVLLPLAIHLTPPRRQGAVIGQIMGGLLTGIMLARPVASFLAAAFGWRAVFFFSAGAMSLIALALLWRCPRRQPQSRMGYLQLIGSVFMQLAHFRALRLRAFYQAMLYAAFNLFWTAAPLTLIGQFGFTQKGIALFALAGAGGALAAPLAGKLADHGHGRMLTLLALGGTTTMFLLADGAVAIGSVLVFAATAILLDGGVQTCQISGQRIIFGLSIEARARINSAYLTSMFIVGASGSVIGTATFEGYGWRVSAMVGAALCATALLTFLLFDRRANSDDQPQAHSAAHDA